MSLTIALINASLPGYFPARHGVFESCRHWLDSLAKTHGATVVSAPFIPMDGARDAVTALRAKGADFLLLLHGGFTMGDVVRKIARAGLPMPVCPWGGWATPEPTLAGDIQLNAPLVGEGRVAEGSAAGFTGCRGRVGGFSGPDGPCPARDVVATVMEHGLEHGLEHHFILVPGRHRSVFGECARWCGMDALPVIPAHDGLPERHWPERHWPERHCK